MRHIHVIALQNPVPADYGGMIDIYYKLKAFHDAGWRITLHAYCYRRPPRAPEFFDPDDRAIFYHRSEGLASNLSCRPYIVESRRDPALLRDLTADDDPILFEGLHTCRLLDHPALRHRKKIVRAHNVEHDYYRQLALATQTFRDRLFFAIEARRLRNYEKILRHADVIAAISLADHAYFSAAYPECRNICVPCFFDNSGPDHLPGSGDYVLYQGNLSVQENEKSALRIIRQIAPGIPEVKFILAGKDPTAAIHSAAEDAANVELVSNPDNATLDRLITDARINLLITHQATGIKLKLLNALCRGAHVVVNSEMIAGTGLNDFVAVADSDADLISAIRKKREEPFSSVRRLPSDYANSHNVARLIATL